MGRTLDEMTEEERHELGMRAYEELVKIWAEENGCAVTFGKDGKQ